MKNVNSKSRTTFAVRAAVAGVLAGCALLGGCGKADAGTPKSEANGCSGRNGCGADKKTGAAAAEKNACSAKADAKKEANSCSGHNGCNTGKKG